MTQSKQFCVYILASRMNGTLYVGITSDLLRRVEQHRTGAFGGFTKEYGVTRLVYFELHETAESAIQREKRLKKWRRAWKIQLLTERNPDWRDLCPEIARF